MRKRRDIEMMTLTPFTLYLTGFLGKKIISDITEAIEREREIYKI